MRVFISYRRDDSAGHAGRLHDQLARRLGADLVFRDVVNIVPGADFVRSIDDAVASCDVLLAVVGARWLEAREEGRPRLDEPADYVRRELAAALSRGIPVVPLLVDRAVMPAEARLPEELQAFARRNALELRDSSWDQDVERLLQAIGHRSDESGVARGRTGPAPPRTGPSRRWLALIGIAAAIAGAAALGRGWLAPRPLPPPSGGTPGSPAPPAPPGPDAHPPSIPLVLPASTRAALYGTGGDSVLYELRAARLEQAVTGQPNLILSLRVTNNTGYPINFWDESFRLMVDDLARAPIGGLNEVVPARSSQDGIVVFRAPVERRGTVLRITAIGQTAAVALGDLAAGQAR